jgi:mRNA-degrading endonuclease toxin of MazEF toxin-antitoxin module
VALGQIHLFDFPLTSGQRGKLRPALELFDLGADLVVAKVASVKKTEPSDLILEEWKQAGLLRESTVRLGCLVTVEKRILCKTIGKLTEKDLKKVKELWNRRFCL